MNPYTFDLHNNFERYDLKIRKDFEHLLRKKRREF